MAKFQTFKGYTGDRPQPPKIPKPETPPDPMIAPYRRGCQSSIPTASRLPCAWFIR